MSWEREKFSFVFIFIYGMLSSSSCKHGLAFLFISSSRVGMQAGILASSLGGNGKVMYFHFVTSFLFFLFLFPCELYYLCMTTLTHNPVLYFFLYLFPFGWLCLSAFFFDVFFFICDL